MNIDLLIKLATLEKNGAAKEAYRAVKNELLLNSSSKNPKSEGKIVFHLVLCTKIEGDWSIDINELDISIIRKQIEIREEQIYMYEANSRKDLADMYREQNKYLKQLLPPEISKDKIEEAVITTYPNGYSKKQMGMIIKEIKDIYPTADGKLIAEVVKSHIL